MSLLREAPPVAPSAVVHRLHRNERFKRTRDRRIFRLVDVDPMRAVAILVPRRGGTPRRVAQHKLAQDYTQVVLCPECGRHHDVHDAFPHRRVA